MKLNIKHIASLLMLCVYGIASAVTPAQVLDAVVSKIQRSQGISATFTGSAEGQSVRGALNMAGNRFRLTTPDVTVWYNGRDMYTANHHTKETTVTRPDDAELAETNPLILLGTAKSQYRAFFSKREAPAGKYLLLLNPRAAGTGIKAIEIQVNAKTNVPERIVLRRQDDVRATLSVGNAQYGVGYSKSEFDYPKAKMVAYQIIDLR